MEIGAPEDILLLGLSFVLGLLSGIIIERINYRNQRRLAEIQRLSPSLTNILGILSKMEGQISVYKTYLGTHSPHFKKQIKTSKNPLVNLLPRYHIKQTRLLIKDCENFEVVYLKLEQNGQLQVVKMYDKKLFQFMLGVHGISENLKSKKVKTGEDTLKLQISVNNLQSHLKLCEERLVKFLK